MCDEDDTRKTIDFPPGETPWPFRPLLSSSHPGGILLFLEGD
jgi:hypothetical protein